jgi:hypothetical protein
MVPNCAKNTLENVWMSECKSKAIRNYISLILLFFFPLQIFKVPPKYQQHHLRPEKAANP